MFLQLTILHHLLRENGITTCYWSVDNRYPKPEVRVVLLQSAPPLSRHTTHTIFLLRLAFGVKLDSGAGLILIDKAACLLLFVLKMEPH